MNTEKNVISDSEIMKQVLSALRYSGLAFAKKLEYSSAGTIHHILNGKNRISDDLVNNIIKHFPEVNYWFLKKGQSPVILNEKPKTNEHKILGTKVGVDSSDYGLEALIILKNIEKILLKISTHLENKA